MIIIVKVSDSTHKINGKKQKFPIIMQSALGNQAAVIPEMILQLLFCISCTLIDQYRSLMRVTLNV